LQTNSKNRWTNVKSNPSDYPKNLSAAFNRKGKTEISEQLYTDGRVKNAKRRRIKSSEEHRERIQNEPSPEERRIKTERMILQRPDPEVRNSLYQWYNGRCQICGKTFAQKDGNPFFIAAYLVERHRAGYLDTVANTMCLCADHFAKWRHCVVESHDIIEQIRSFKPQVEGGTKPPELHIKLCGEDCTIMYNEKHLIDLQELIKEAENNIKQPN
jgi:hypothetical protein